MIHGVRRVGRGGRLLLFVGATGGFVWSAQALTPNRVEFGGYATTLEGRTRGQAHNAVLAATKIDGAVIAPKDVFSFNRKVGSYSRDQGYRKAPVSYNGQLIIAWGGGVCQTSSTLYNAALIGGMRIVERHPHRFQPAYVPPGRDAAVAFETVDLKFQNPYDFPVRIRAVSDGGRIVVSFVAERIPESLPEVVSRVHHRIEPAIIEVAPGRNRMTNGKAGYEVSVMRRWPAQGRDGERLEKISDNVYPPMHRLLPER